MITQDSERSFVYARIISRLKKFFRDVVTVTSINLFMRNHRKGDFKLDIIGNWCYNVSRTKRTE